MPGVMPSGQAHGAGGSVANPLTDDDSGFADDFDFDVRTTAGAAPGAKHTGGGAAAPDQD